MVIQKMKRLSGFMLMMAAVPAAIFLAPRIGLWTIALVLGSGALGGWLTIDPSISRTGGSIDASAEEEDEEEEKVRLSIASDPAYAFLPENAYHTYDHS